eukprot:CAMPEP_0119003446 /NCGR_PEP_ID=MMETSP1176-20130426/565_1 /TAXON_ID=265551 /ORGANISM="Synedropsis recta cf, Strain CCMP1620" /LENGTH=272 /DNA_ID=CAMNT_0006955049 /DNA_START=18 /DNA_END=836 /DNA_ORIENTATION=+
MNLQLQHVPSAATQRGAWVVELIRQSPMPIPIVRKNAIRESCRSMLTEEGLCDVFLEAVCDSPYLSEGKKQELATVILLGRWHELPKLVGVRGEIRPPVQCTNWEVLADFKYMAASIYRKSRKIQQLPVWKRRAIGSALLSCNTREDLIEFLMRSLENAQTLDEHSRQLIANDVLECQFHRLLLKDRFDCDEMPRLETSPDPSAPCEECEDCIICFGPFGDSCTTLSCGHAFCRVCIQDWADRLGSPFPCPLCRENCRLGAADQENDGTTWS